MRHASPSASRVVVGVGLMAVLMMPAPAAAQGGACELVSVGGYTYRTRFDSVSFVHHASGGIDYRCVDGMRILADSAVVFESNEQVHLFGRVHLVDADTELDADSAQYFGGLKQLNAWSNVTVRDHQSGAVISGHRLLYDRATEVRPLDRMQVYEGSPHATVYPVARAAPPPVEDSVPVGDSVPAGDSVPVGDSVPAGDSVPVGDSVPAGDSVPVGDSVALGDSVPVQDSMVAAVTVPEGDSVVAAVTVPEGDSVVMEDPPPVEVVEDLAAGEDGVAVEDTVALPPYEIDAERFILEGRRYFRAGGNVVVVRDSLLAFGDSLDYDQEVGSMSIMGDARVEGQEFLLTASTVSVTPSTGLKEELLARQQATLSGQQVNMVAPAIRMFLDNGQVDRIVAIGEVPPLPGEPQGIDTEGLSPGDAARVWALAEAAMSETDSLAVADSLFRPSVAADQFNLIGDSIDVLSPGQVLDLVTAVGTARAEGQPDDSVAARGLPEVARRDWMEGDTIYARFASPGSADSTTAADSADAAADSADSEPEPVPPPPTPPPDGQESSRLETMTAVGSARSLYRLVDSDTVQANPGTALAVADESGVESDTILADQPGSVALHWVEGEKIIVYLEGRQVVKMDVEGQTVGYHLEPLPPGAAPDSAAVAPDSATVRADSTTVRPDTATARPDTATARRGRK